jgi:hypothetical protein
MVLHQNDPVLRFSVFLDMFETLIDNGSDMGIRQRIKDRFAFPARLHQLALFEDLQLMGDRGLCHIECLSDIADTDLRLKKDKKDPDSRGIPENLEKFRKIIQIFFIRKFLVDNL